MSNEKKYGLIVISAPSGAGKSTLCTRLLGDIPEKLALSISTTTRAPRGTERHAKEYFFTERNDFELKIKEDSFAEWAAVHQNYYGTLKSTLEKFWSEKKHVLLDIDVQGAESLRKLYPDRCFSVFISPPDMKELERRLRGRGTETEAAIQERMKHAHTEMKSKDDFHFVLVNDTFETAYQKLKASVLEGMSLIEEGKWPKRP